MAKALRAVGLAAVLLGSALAEVNVEDPNADNPFCIGDSGTPVYWWVAIKEPGSTNYLYMDNIHPNFVQSKHDMSSRTVGALAQTLKRSYESSFGTVFFNSAPPGGSVNPKYGQSKGVLTRDARGGGSWLIHSANNFPAAGAYTGYTSPASPKYAQSFMCATLYYDQLEQAAYQLLVDQVHVYYHNLPASLKGYGNFSALAKGGLQNTPPTSMQNFEVGRDHFTSFSRGLNSGVHLYEDLIAKHFRTGLMTETYQNGAGHSPSFCKPSHEFNVNNIIKITTPYANWTETKDHSKWAVSGSFIKRASTKVVCMTDINRKTSNSKVGGGGLCVSGNTQMYEAFYNLVEDAHVCPPTSGEERR